MYRAIAPIAALAVLACLAACEGGTRGAGLPESVVFEIAGSTGAEGFVSLSGTSNLPPGSRVLVSVTAAPNAGSDLVENALVTIAGDGSFGHRTLLGYPVSYALRAEFVRAGNPEHAEWFGEPLKDAKLPPGVVVQMEPDGSYKLVANARWRIGTEQQEAELIARRLDALGERVSRMRYDRKNLERTVGEASGQAAAAAYLSWARIRGGKEKDLGIADPALDPFFGELDLDTRRLWRDLGEGALHVLASSLGEEKEAARTESAWKRYLRDVDKMAGRIESQKGNAP